MAHTEHDAPSTPEPLPRLFMRRARASAHRVAYHAKSDQGWVATSWHQARERVEAWASGLLELGGGPQIPVAIMSSTRPEWSQIDMANLCVGGVTVGLYPNLTRTQVRQLLRLCGARLVVVEDRAKRLLVQDAVSDFEQSVRIITMETEDEVSGAPAVSLRALRRLGLARQAARPDELDRRLAERHRDEVVSYIYTSGTTGTPKGAMLTHRNFHYVINATNALVPYGKERALVFLPMADSLQRYANYLNLMVDVELYYGGALLRLENDLSDVSPTCFAAVPRVLEKLRRRVVGRALVRAGVPASSFDSALEAMQVAAQQHRGGIEPGLRGRLRARLADHMVGRHVRGELGGQVKFIGSGGEPMARDLHTFFEAVGVPVLVGYGATETCAPACLNTLNNRRIGTVGRPLPGTEIRIADDGEILIRGPGVFRGYFQDVRATEEALTDDGWFKTGDVGTMSRDGFLTITDRKSDLILTSTGDNVAPRPLELALQRHPWVGQAIVVGEGRPYLGALLSLDPEVVPSVAMRVGLSPTADAAEVSSHPKVQYALEQHLDALNAELPRSRRIERFSVLADKLTTTSGELTPTMKVKRRVVNERRGPAIERLYRP